MSKRISVESKPRRMFVTFILAVGVPGAILLALFIFLVLFGALYVTSSNRAFLIILIALFVILSALYAVSAVMIINRLYRAFYDGLYRVTKDNLSALSHNYKDIKKYPNYNIEEFNYLNDDIDNLESRFASGYLIATIPNYSNIKLDYISEERRIVTFESFKNELENIIFLSQSYQNVIIDTSFNVDNIDLTKEQENYLISVYEEAFKDYCGRLYVYNPANKTYLIYLPVIDSFSKIKELLGLILRECSLTVRGMSGTSNASIKFSVVCYPYSEINELLTDLRYAKRQGKIINFYLPNRIKTNFENNYLLISNSMNVNYMNRFTSLIYDLSYNSENVKKDKEKISEVLSSISTFLKIDEAGIILYDQIAKSYEYFIKNSNGNEMNITPYIDDFISVVNDNIDEDRSYYFSKRSHANNSLARHIDLIGISSGFIYLLKNDEKVLGLIYFVKRKEEFIIDSYIRESLLFVSMRLEHYFVEMNLINDIDLYRSESEYVLSLSDYSLYKIDDDYRLTYYSKDLKTKFKNLDVGEKCHKAFYGLEKPCHDCPITTFKKKALEYRKENYLISLTLNDRKTHNRSLLIERVVNKDENHDLYDKDLLINSYLSLKNNLINSYEISGRGYVLLLAIDDIDLILEKEGSEGTLFVLRAFIKKLKNLLKNDEIYYFNSSTIALLLHGVGHVDVINTCEKIYELSKEHYLEHQTNDTLNITYMALGWPRGYASGEDFLRHTLDFYINGNHERNKDFIYFSDHSIARSASKRIFMISVIEQELTSTNFSSVSLQPIVKAKDKKIFGAEILLRINNVYSNAIFNAEEISRITEQEGKTSLLTESIINFIGAMYKEYGSNIFKINEFNRFCINIDSTYLKDTNLVKGIIKLNDTYNFPNNFLSFEIPEEIIPNHASEIQKMARELSSAHIYFSVDRYTGQYVSVEKIRELGFNEIKLTRDLIGKIDSDSVKFNAVQDIIAQAKENKILVAAVGVENSAQFSILRDLDETMMMQGYHFFKPLSRSDFIAALISHNH